ncbi:MAG: hypothetical protein V2G41_09950, partial [bacterium JZ-2024 1]
CIDKLEGYVKEIRRSEVFADLRFPGFDASMEELEDYCESVEVSYRLIKICECILDELSVVRGRLVEIFAIKGGLKDDELRPVG